MLDLSKPIQTRDGREAVILTAAATPALKAHLEATSPCPVFIGRRDTIIAEVAFPNGKKEINGYTADGRFSEWGEDTDDLVNLPEVPSRSSEFRTFQPDPRANRNSLGNFRARSADELAPQLVHLDNLDRPLWQGVLEIIREGDKVVDVKFHPREA